MDNCCNCHNEISRDGSGQLDRYLKALDPAYAPLDDRSMEDLLVFAKRYANQIRFYDIPESNTGLQTETGKTSWREFFRRDIAVITASIAITDLQQFRKDYDEQRAKVDVKPAPNTFDDLFDPILGMAAKIDGWYALSIPEYPLYDDLKLAIDSNLKAQMQKIVAYEEGFKYVDSKHPLNLDYSAIQNKEIWGLSDTINADISIYQGAETDERIRNATLAIDDVFNSFHSFLSQLVANSDSYMHFALEQYPAHQPHMALFITFLQLFRLAQDQMNGLTRRMLDFYYHDVLHLTAKPSVPDKVHIVFELAKDVLEYDVAQQTALKGGKDASGKEQVYKTVNDLVVNGAKVKELKNIFIEKVNAVETQATVTTGTKQIIQQIYARPVANSRDGFGEKFTVPNSKWPTFGKGSVQRAAVTNLCNEIQLLNELADRKDRAQIGFAIASPQLVLQGGKRLVQIKLDVDTALFQKARAFESLHRGKSFFEVSLTGEKGWFKIENILSENEWDRLILKFKNKNGTNESIGIFNPDLAYLQSAYYLDVENNSIVLYLPVAEQPIIAFNAKTHPGYDFKTSLPVIMIMVNPLINLTEEEYNNYNVKNLTVNVKVGSVNPSVDKQREIIASEQFESPQDLFTFHYDGLKKLVLQNKDGLITRKPFDPYTAYPLPGRSFYIGSDEIFNKPFTENDQLAINLEKTLEAEESEEPSDGVITIAASTSQTFSERYIVRILEKRDFLQITQIIPEGQDRTDFSREELTENILAFSKLSFDRLPLTPVTEWSTETEKGFIRLDLNLNRRIFSNTSTNTSYLQASQNLAPLLEIKDISVSYDSTLQLEVGTDQFFHIYPFGVIETYLHPPLSKAGSDERTGNSSTSSETFFSALDKAKEGLLVDSGNALFPQFNYISPYAEYYKDATTSVQASATTLTNVAWNVSSVSTSLPVLTRSKSRNAAQLMLGTSGSSTTEELANQYTGAMQEGMLFIGLQNLKPLQSISMLFQFAEGSAENEDDDPPPINWSYLTCNEWRPLKAEHIVSDGTYGFQTTGIIKIDIPADASVHNTIITDGLLWLCASVTKDADRIPQLIDIVTQAVEAKFEDQNNDISHFDNALAAGSIAKMVTAVAEISKVQQPFASFDGKQKEVGKAFYTRVSERLRHKGRAINAWDYEHLVLDRFPGIYKVKCITHTDPNCLCRNKESAISSRQNFRLSYNANQVFSPASEEAIGMIKNSLKQFTQTKATITAYAPEGNVAAALAIANRLALSITADGSIAAERITTATAANGPAQTIDVYVEDSAVRTTKKCCGPQLAPGHVLLIPIANLKNRNAANPLQPKTSRRTLIAIQEYLKTRTSPFVHVHAKNPVYEQIIVSFKVKFYTGTDKGFYIKKLNEEIVHFLTPWAFDENAEVAFNQKIYASSIINFIEDRTYVDFITDFVMGVCCNECCPPVVTPAGTTITGTIKDSQGKPLAAVGITAKNEDSFQTSQSDANGQFSLSIGTGVVAVTFSLPGYETKVITAGEKTNFDIILYTFNEVLQGACSCQHIEQLLQNNVNFEGDIVAKPCTSRSILVSVPQHIIVPYEAPPQLSPCEKRRVEKSRTEQKRVEGNKPRKDDGIQDVVENATTTKVDADLPAETPVTGATDDTAASKPSKRNAKPQKPE